MGARFHTEWDTAPNPRYDVWTVTNGGEILPGVLTPFIATLYNEIDAKGLKDLMGTYATGKRVTIHKPPIGNFFGITVGRGPDEATRIFALLGDGLHGVFGGER